MSETIEIRGRTFAIEVIADDDTVDSPPGRPAGPRYRLTGVRGADYHTFRTVPNPAVMFLIGFRKGGFTPDPLGPGVWLTDAGGELRLKR